MKTKILTLILAGVSSLAVAQKKIDLSRSIDDDGEKLTVRVNGTIDGKIIDYDQTFKVADLTKEEKNALTDRILDSLGVGRVEPPAAPDPPRSPRAHFATRVPEAPTAPEPPTHLSLSASDSGDYPVITARKGNDMVHAVGGLQPFTKELKYNPESGQMFMRYRFNKNDEEYTYEKTLNVLDKSEEERQKIIADFEKEIELPGRN